MVRKEDFMLRFEGVPVLSPTICRVGGELSGAEFAAKAQDDTREVYVMKMKKLACSLIAAGCLMPMIASATNGYFSHGYGMKGKGRVGVSTAFTDDTFGGANNPAQMAWVGQPFTSR